ncbi:uncharacterized protein Bfra_004209 [Botrytis fragariae]|uniref:Uncharacterized protein n=1 Tax=Botrytis fragariae TaxID=1964551 RepID=A0A8H6EJ62_9HELO|nr:uncharacterized protein Bfra_004209 [Botrytis fragariae]KAF5874203.1 hypothetical protein Bfra_004209 [Botrytis fragariae]
MDSIDTKRDPTTHMVEVNFESHAEAETLDISHVGLRDTYPEPGSTGKSPRLTFGVELEIAVGTLRDICQNPTPKDGRRVYGVSRPANSPPLEHDPRPANFGKSSLAERSYRAKSRFCVYENIAQTLSCAGFPAIHMDDAEYQKTGYTNEMTSKWIIGTDISIDLPNESIYDYHKLEIKSPVYYFSEEALSDVKRVWGIIASTYKVVTNESMGLHVYVGNGVDAFDNETLRNLWGILWTTEKWIETIHPPHRRFNPFCQSFHRCSNLGREIEERSLKDPEEEVLEWILTRTPPTVREFLDTICIHSGAYNFVNLQPSHNVESTKRTIEFRQHEATLDTERISQWIRACVGIVKASAAADPAVLDPYLRLLAQTKREKLRVWDILKELGLEGSGVYYKARMLRERSVGIVVKELWEKTTRFVKR